MKTIMIICILGDPMIPPVSCDRSGGFNTDAKELIAYLADQPYKCVIITNKSVHKQQMHTKLSDKMELYRIDTNVNDFNDQHELEDNYEFIYGSIVGLIDKIGKPSLIHSFYWFSGAIAAQLSNKYSVPFVHSVVAFSMDKKNSLSSNDYSVQYKFERLFLNKAECIFAITDKEKETAIKDYELPGERIVIVGRDIDGVFSNPARNEKGTSRGLDTAKIEIPSLSPLESTYWWNGGVFTYVGRLKKEKGVHIIIQAWRKLYDHFGECTPSLWLIGGDVESIEKMRRVVKEYVTDLSDFEKVNKICWWGYLDSLSISAVFLKTLVLVAHSQYDAGGRTVIEAMSQKKPVIGTNVGFVADLIKDWENGFVVDYGDINGLCERMSFFVSQPLLSNTLGNNARHTVDAAREAWNYYDVQMDVYNTILNNGKMTSGGISVRLRNERPDTPDYFKMGLLTTYPYDSEYLSPKSYIQSQDKKEYHFTQINNYFDNVKRWNIGGRDKELKLFQYYSEMNKAPLYNVFVKQETIPGKKRYENAVACSEISDSVMNTVDRFPEILSFTVTDAAALSMAEIIEHKNEIIDALFKFNTKSSIKSLILPNPLYGPQNPCSLNAMLSELMDPSQADYDPDLKGFVNSQMMILTEMLSKSRCSSIRNGVNYGKSIKNNVVMFEGKIKLLPVSEIYTGEIGYDMGMIMTDLISNNTPENEISELLKAISCIYETDRDLIFIWYMFALFEKLFISIKLKIRKDFLTYSKLFSNAASFYKTLVIH